MASNLTRQLVEQAAVHYERVMAELLPAWDWPCHCVQPGGQLHCLECPGFRLLIEAMQARLSETPQETFVQLPPIKRQRPYSEQVQQDCVELFQRGYTLSKIQALTGVTNRKTLRAWLIERHLIDTSVHAHELQRTRCLELYEQGLKPAEVEDLTGVPADVTAHWATQAGVARPNPTFTAEQQQTCLDLYRSGLSAEAISQQTGLPKDRIKKWIKESGIKRPRISGGGRPPKYSPEQQEEVIALFRAGDSTQQIEEKTGIGANTLIRWLKRHCLQLLDAGVPPQQIEAEFGVGSRVLKKWWTTLLRDRAQP